jgi:hypothetical protein
MQIIVNRSEITVKLDAEDFFKALEEYLEADIAEEFDDEDDLLEEL